MAISRQRYTRPEEWANAATHGFGAVLGLVGLGFLISQALDVGRNGSLAAVIIYGAALVLLFTFSALHHAVIGRRLKQTLLAFDHCGIYLLIAGTYTPFALLMPAGREWTLLALIWGLAGIGIAGQMTAFLTGRSDRYERFAYLFYLSMAWIPALWVRSDVFDALAGVGLDLLAAGGIAYSVGVIFYKWKGLRFGHAVWHLFVVAGSGLHFFSIFFYIVPAAI